MFEDFTLISVFILLIIIIVIIVVTFILKKKSRTKDEPIKVTGIEITTPEQYVQPLSTGPKDHDQRPASSEEPTARYLESDDKSYGDYGDQYQSLYGTSSTPPPSSSPSVAQQPTRKLRPRIKPPSTGN